MNQKRNARPNFWLLAEPSEDGMAPLTLWLSGTKALAVFSAREEAEMYASFGSGLGGRWEARRVDDGKLLSLLVKGADGLEYVALDPLPEELSWLPLELIGLRWDRFMRLLSTRMPPNLQPEFTKLPERE